LFWFGHGGTGQTGVLGVHILYKPYLPHPDSDLDVPHMNFDVETYPIVKSKLYFVVFDHTGLIGGTHRSDWSDKTCQFWVRTAMYFILARQGDIIAACWQQRTGRASMHGQRRNGKDVTLGCRDAEGHVKVRPSAPGNKTKGKKKNHPSAHRVAPARTTERRTLAAAPSLSSASVHCATAQGCH
jgi:hypothetical protein